MKKLLKLVFFRLRKEKAPWIELSIAIAFGLIYGAVYAYIASLSSGSDSVVNIRSTILGTFSPSYNIPTALAVAGSVAFFHTEINYGTLRNQITSGYSRKQIFISYWIGVLALSFMIMLGFTAANLLVSAWFIPVGFTASNVGPFFMSIGFGVLQTVAIITLAYFLTHLMKSPAWPILIVILLGASSVIVDMLAQMIFFGVSPNATADDLNTFFSILVFLPNSQSAAITSGSYGIFTDGLFFANLTANPTGADYTANYVFAILLENLVVLAGSFFGGFFYFDRHDLK